jgi:hypothetical protein
LDLKQALMAAVPKALEVGALSVAAVQIFEQLLTTHMQID